MLLRLTTVDQQNQFREFTYTLDQIELGIDFLNQLVAQGDIILTAQLVDEQSVVNLPIDSFDGTMAAKQIADLEKEWLAILAKPYQTASGFRLALRTMTNNRIAFCECEITQLDPLIMEIEKLQAYIRQMNISYHSKLVLENNYQQKLDKYQAHQGELMITRKHLLNLAYRLS